MSGSPVLEWQKRALVKLGISEPSVLQKNALPSLLSDSNHPAAEDIHREALALPNHVIWSDLARRDTAQGLARKDALGKTTATAVAIMDYSLKAGLVELEEHQTRDSNTTTILRFSNIHTLVVCSTDKEALSFQQVLSQLAEDYFSTLGPNGGAFLLLTQPATDYGPENECPADLRPKFTSDYHVGSNCQILITSVQSAKSSQWTSELLPLLNLVENSPRLRTVVFDGAEKWPALSRMEPLARDNLKTLLQYLAARSSKVRHVCLARFIPQLLRQHFMNLQSPDPTNQSSRCNGRYNSNDDAIVQHVADEPSPILVPARALIVERSLYFRDSAGQGASGLSESSSEDIRVPSSSPSEGNRQHDLDEEEKVEVDYCDPPQSRIILERCEETPTISSFEDTRFSVDALRGVYSCGFEKPRQLQAEALPQIAKGRDTIINQWPQGSGKSATAALGALLRLPCQQLEPSAVLIVQSRESAILLAEMLNGLGQYLPQVQNCNRICARAFVGGQRVQDDLKALKQGVLFAVGCPGRLSDIIRRGALRLEKVNYLTLDDGADLLSQANSENIYQIFKYMPKDVQVVVLSSFLPKDCEDVTRKFMREPAKVQLGDLNLPSNHSSRYVAVEEDCKLDTLMDLYQCLTDSSNSTSSCQQAPRLTIVLCRTRRKVDWVAELLQRNKLNVSFLHCDMPRGDREKVLRQTRSGCINMLISTPDMLRGINFHHCYATLLYDLPFHFDEFVKDKAHGPGASSQVHDHGHLSLFFISQSDVKRMRYFEAAANLEIEELELDFRDKLLFDSQIDGKGTRK